nr:FAD:protein FMN transferase [Pseudenhygromyxa sp. WMMC2535]
MGTRTSVNVWVGGGDALAAKRAIEAAFAEMARIEDIASEWRSDSDLSKLNARAGQGPFEVAPELVEILARAREVSADTEGLFDVSFYAVGQLWRFEPGAKPPTTAAISERLPLVDWTKVEVDASAHTATLARPGMKVGLGAIAKGYAVDRAAALLTERGFANFIVEAGGDTYLSGRKGSQDWRVGVQDPGQANARVGHLVASDQAVVTSGNYARFFVWEGVHYTHILDPRSGWPIRADDSPKSVTLIAADATTADAYCTAVSVMKPEQGLAFVEARPQLEAVIIGPDDRLLVSSGLGERFVDERAAPL